MIRLLIDEYVRNFWFHLCIIVLMAVMMIVSSVLISNIEEETNLYRLAKRYMDEDSLFLSNVESKYVEAVSECGEVLATKRFWGRFENNIYSSIETTVYTDEVMKYLNPRLDSGTYPEDTNTDERTIYALISRNPYGIKTGDTFTYNIFWGDSVIPVKVYVTGVISEGQKLYAELDNISREMTYEDFFPVYSYEQTGVERLIIQEKELEKIPEVKEVLYYSNVIINPTDDFDDEEKNKMWDKIKLYDMDFLQTGIEPLYPDAKVLKERNDIIFKSRLMKYLPLCMIIVMLFSISIIGIITIKTARSIRYYGIMYTFGMYYNQAQVITGAEMGFNSLMAFMSAISLMTLQKKLNWIGEINCNIDVLEIIVMAVLCMMVLVGAMLVTRDILKEHTPVEILINLI